MASPQFIESSLIIINPIFAYEKSHKRTDTRVVRRRMVRICAAGQTCRRGARRLRRQANVQIHSFGSERYLGFTGCGLERQKILRNYSHSRISAEAIKEAVQLAKQKLLDNVRKFKSIV